MMIDIGQLLASLGQVVGTINVLAEPADCAPYLVDWRGSFRGEAVAIVRPSSTQEVADVVTLCAQHDVAIVPQGGNTGLVGGSVPIAQHARPQIVLSTRRLNRVRGIDANNFTLTCEAGCVLANVQEAARDHQRLFPLSLAAEGSCTIGGNLSTNAGGVQVLRYGNARELTLGIEAVLADGRVWNGLRGLRKDNTGYDLKDLLIGAEGTLGVITAAVLKLFPLPSARATLLAAVRSPREAVVLLTFLRARLGERLSAYEMFSNVCLDLVLERIPNTHAPFAEAHPWYVLIEAQDTGTTEQLDTLTQGALAAAIEHDWVLDAVWADSEARRASLWRLREEISEAQRRAGPNVKHDVSVPVSQVAELIARGGERLERALPGVAIVAFGHVGDGNIHYNVNLPAGAKATQDDPRVALIGDVVYDLVSELGGSISAEHGVGQLKRDEIRRRKSQTELDLMRAIKRAIDPCDRMNPGKVL